MDIPVQPKQPDTEPTVNPLEPTSVPPFLQAKKIFLILGGVFILSLLIFVALYFSLPSKLAKQIFHREQIAQEKERFPRANVAKTTQWVNCNDIRDVIEEENKLYVACLGGVLVVDANSGEVIDQISMANGLGNHIANSLVKKGDVLFIGTQDGFTIFNLKSHQAKKISVEEGLISGSNIELANDGRYLWVGTFDGLSRYNTETSEIKNFNQELSDSSSKWNINRILVTPRAVYATVLASAYSQGGVARWDKATQTWEKFGVAAFLETVDQYSRVDFFELVSVGDRVLISDSGNMIWESEDKPGSAWNRLESVFTAIKGDEKTITPHLVGGEVEAGIVVNGLLHKYNPSTGEIKVVYPNFTHGDNVLWQSDFIRNASARGKKIWVKPYATDFSSRTDAWLGWLRLADLKSGYIILYERPKEFGELLAVIDGKLILTGSSGVFEYNPSTNGEFKRLLEMDLPFMDSAAPIFQPIFDSPQVFVYSQVCGQGCDEPKFAIFDYQEGSIKFLSMSDEVAKKIKSSFGRAVNYIPVDFQGYDSQKGELEFKVSFGEGVDRIVLRTSDWSWEIEKITQSDSQEPSVNPFFCNPNYEFVHNGGKFKDLGCPKEAANVKFRWVYEKFDGENYQLFQINKSSGERVELEMPAAPNPYSPFEDWKFPHTVSKMTYTDGHLWVGTNKGLAVYNPNGAKWELISTDNGLVSNEITSFVVNGKAVWISTHWGGLAAIVRQ